MPRKEVFVHKLLDKIDRVDQKSVRSFLQKLIEDNALLEEVFTLLEEGVVVLNPDTTLHSMNQKAADTLGIDPRHIAPKTSFFNFLPDGELEKKLRFHFKNPFAERILDHVQLLIPRELEIRLILIPVPKFNKVLLLLITPQEREADRLTHMASLVKLASGIAHEIGNPLNSIMIHLRLLTKQTEKIPEKLKDPLEKNLSAIRAETERLDNIIRNFLKATRNPPLRFKLENLNDIMEESILFLKPELDLRQIHVSFDKDGKLPLSLFDREKIHQVNLNIIKNSMEAMPQGGKLNIRIFHKGKVVWLEFRDEGQGIKEEDLPYIFDAYFTTKQSGSGLGLMTVYNIVRQHGGRIQVKSTPGKGSLFSIALPLRQPKLQLPEPKRES